MEENSPQGILGSYRGQDAGGIRRKRMFKFSVLQPQCPEDNSEGKDTENCRFILLPTKNN